MTTAYYSNYFASTDMVFSSTSLLSAYDTSTVSNGSTLQDGAIAIVTDGGMFQWAKNGTETVNGTTILTATGGGQWLAYTDPHLVMNSSNIVDASQVQISGSDVALTTGRVFVGVGNVATATTLTSGQVLVGNGSSLATPVSVTGDVTLSNAGVTAIASGVIVNADVNASAAIDFSKLATLTSGNVLVGSAGNVATSVAVSGDITLSNAGVAAIASGVIVNADVNASAAIDFSKLATLTSANILVGSAGNVATSVAMSGDATISNTGALTIAANAVTTAKILDSNVTLGKLASGITPSHVIKYAGTTANGGGSATIALTVSGVASTDVVFAQVSASTNAVSVQKVTATTNTITVILSGDPGAATVISYQALRAAA